MIMLAALLSSQVSMAAPMTTNTVSMPKAYSTGAHGSNPILDGISPTTGLPSAGEYRPVVVQISNTDGARPHLNMSEADIVYEAIYWGPAHTRYTAIYNDNHPEQVGSIRSARWHHLELRQEWDAPFVFWGGQREPGTNIDDFIKDNNVPKNYLFDGTGSPPAGTLSRINTRVSPHNAVANLAEVVNHWPTNESGEAAKPRNHAFKFSETPSRGSDTAVEINIKYDEGGKYNPSYTYNAQTRQYERWYNGEEQIDGASEKRLTASNVIVQYAPLSFYNSIAARPMLQTTGGGTIDAFIDGQHIRGTWDRKGLNDRTVFMDLGGNELTLLPGKTYIQIVPLSQSFTYTKADGEVVTADIGMSVPIVTVEADTAEIDNVEGLE